MSELVTPAKAGVQSAIALRYWIPAYAGMTESSGFIVRALYLPDFDVQRQDAVGDLAWSHPEQAGSAGLDPAGLFERGDDARPFIEIRIVETGGRKA